MKTSPQQIVVIGGGTGTSVTLKGLKKHTCNLVAIVVVSDSGGSTGRLRDEFGFLPVGDLRQCLAALSKSKNEPAISQMLLYRFKQGKGLKGHSLGNLILTALEDLSESPGQAIETAAHIFDIKGQVLPITETLVELYTEYQDGTIKIGEHLLDDPQNGGKKIKQIRLKPQPKIYHKAKHAIEKADMIVMGPGDLYASLLPNTLALGFKQALQANQGKFIYVVNLMTHYSQTHDMTAQDHLDQISKYCGRQPDFAIMNNQQIDSNILQRYRQKKEFPVIDDLQEVGGPRIIRQPLVAKAVFQAQASDSVPRSLLRHDSNKLADLIMSLQ